MKRAYQVLHGSLARLVDAFHELQHVVREFIYNCDSNVEVILVLQMEMSIECLQGKG